MAKIVLFFEHSLANLPSVSTRTFRLLVLVLILFGGLPQMPKALTAYSGSDSFLPQCLRPYHPKVDTVFQYICFDSPLQEGLVIGVLKDANGLDSMFAINRVRLEEKKLDLNTKVCRGQGIRVGNSFFDKEGSYTVVISNVGPALCDSTVFLNLEVVDSLIEYKNVSLCNGETYTYNSKIYRTQTSLRNEFVTSNKCDSIYYLNINVYACVMRYQLSWRDVGCAKSNSGAILVNMQDSAYINYFYTWTNLATGIVSSTFLIKGDSQAEIGLLTAGRYLVTFDNGDGLFRYDTLTIGQTQPFNIQARVSDYQGYAINCFGDRNGSIELTVSGGNPPYVYKWADGSNSNLRTALAAGMYSVTVLDTRNCSGQFDTLLRAPAKIKARVKVKSPSCYQFVDGIILIDSLQHALSPVRFTINDALPQQSAFFDKLAAGNYRVKIVDGRNCSVDTATVLTEPPPLTVDAGSDVAIDQGAMVNLKGIASVPPGEISRVLWNNVQDPVCPICLEKNVAPVVSTRYSLTVFDKNNCKAEDFVTVTVRDLRVFVPNSFSPNDDGFNDYFTVFGDSKAFKVKSMRIYSRWGDLVFEASDLPPSDELRGWDGKFRGVIQSDGMYVYNIEIELLNDIRRNIKGEVFIVK